MHFLKDQKELEEVFIKKLFDYKLSSAKFLPTVNWSELVVTTVDILWWMVGSVNGGFDWCGEIIRRGVMIAIPTLEKAKLHLSHWVL